MPSHSMLSSSVQPFHALKLSVHQSAYPKKQSGHIQPVLRRRTLLEK
jgi:hypothetical protein